LQRNVDANFQTDPTVNTLPKLDQVTITGKKDDVVQDDEDTVALLTPALTTGTSPVISAIASIVGGTDTDTVTLVSDPPVRTTTSTSAPSVSVTPGAKAQGKTASSDEFWLGGKFRKGHNPLKGFEYLLGTGAPYAEQLQALIDAVKDTGPTMTAEEAAQVASEAPPEPTYSYYSYGTAPTIRLAKGGNVPTQAKNDTMVSPLMAAYGGIPHKGSHYVQGDGGGQDDLIPAQLADGEYVFDAEIVAALGDGSNKEGARKLDAMREAIRKHKRSGPLNTIPPKAKSPLAYLKGAK
jgi:hypothetical protein